jgi:hypothetical protein
MIRLIESRISREQQLATTEQQEIQNGRFGHGQWALHATSLNSGTGTSAVQQRNGEE